MSQIYKHKKYDYEVETIGESYSKYKEINGKKYSIGKMSLVRCRSCSLEYEVLDYKLKSGSFTRCSKCFKDGRVGSIPYKKKDYYSIGYIHHHWNKPESVRIMEHLAPKIKTANDGSTSSISMYKIECTTCSTQWESEGPKLLKGRFKLCPTCKKVKYKKNGSLNEPNRKENRQKWLIQEIEKLTKQNHLIEKQLSTYKRELGNIIKSKVKKQEEELKKQQQLIEELHQVSDREFLKGHLHETLSIVGIFERYGVANKGRTMLINDITFDGYDYKLDHAWLDGHGNYKQGDLFVGRVTVIKKGERYFLKLF